MSVNSANRVRTAAFCGKGGVGKTTKATATALWLASQGKRVCLLDTDRGHSVPRALGLDKASIPVNTLCKVGENLDVVVIDGTKFVSVRTAKEEHGWTISQYLDQFPGDKGLIAWADMLNAFFGAPTDIATVEKFIVLVAFLVELEEQGYDYIVIDVEPTAGLERLLTGADRMSQSLLNLKGQKKFFLNLIGVRMPDIKAYLEGSYIKQANVYTKRIQRAVTMIKQAAFFLVCTPEEEPVRQTFDVSELINGFGGSLAGCVVNRVQGKPHEEDLLALLCDHNVSILRTSESSIFHTDPDSKRNALEEMGREICDHYSL